MMMMMMMMMIIIIIIIVIIIIIIIKCIIHSLRLSQGNASKFGKQWI